MTGYRIDPNRRQQPVKEPATPQLTRRRKQPTNELYLTLKGIYLKENPQCTRPGCLKNAVFIHHVVRGTAGRARSLLNTDTWLGVCSDACHDEIEKLPAVLQRKLKEHCVGETIERLRK